MWQWNMVRPLKSAKWMPIRAASPGLRLSMSRIAAIAGGRPLTVLDWQSLAFGCGVTDVAYFLAGALKRDERRRVERELLAEYHQRLGELGVRYDFEQLWTDYRSRAFALFLVAFYAAMLVTQTPRGDDMFLAMARGSAEQVLDLDSLDFLD